MSFAKPGRFAQCGLVLLVIVHAAWGQSVVAPPALSISTQSLQNGVIGKSYGVQLAATGGSPPLSWQLVQGDLPPGLQLTNDGFISGMPSSPGNFRFVVAVTDSSTPSLRAQQEFTLRVVAPLSIQWNPAPTAQGDTISGRVAVSTRTGDALDLTVIVVAVNTIGKAFALGYQRFAMQGQAESQMIPFGSNLPTGAYVVYADAIGEMAGTNTIFRAHLQTSGPIEISSP